MTYLNPVLVVALAAAAVFGLVVACDPKAAEMLASVLYARAQAVRAGRAAYAAARRAKLGLGGL